MEGVLSEVVTGIVINPMPKAVQENDELMNRFFKAAEPDPLKGTDEFISYLFQTVVIWLIVTSEIFCSAGRMISETIVAKKGEGETTFIKWGKASAYYAWSSFLLPLIFLSGYVFKESRDALGGVSVPVTEDFARRLLLAKEEELDETKALGKATANSLKAKEKELGETSDRVQALELQIRELVAAGGGRGGGGADQVVVQLTTRISELEAALKEEQERSGNLLAHEKMLEEERGQLKSRIETLLEQVKTMERRETTDEELIRKGRTAVFLRMVHTLRRQSGSGDITFKKRELDRYFGEGTS